MSEGRVRSRRGQWSTGVLAAALIMAAIVSAPHAVEAQLPPLSPSAGVCPVPEARGRPAGGGSAAEPSPALPGPAFDQAVPAGENYAIAEFRLWYPEGLERVRAVLVLTPGSNGDGRNQVMDEVWEAFALEHDLALVGVRLRDHSPGIFEDYVNVGRGSGDAFLTAMEVFASDSGRPELATVAY